MLPAKIKTILCLLFLQSCIYAKPLDNQPDVREGMINLLMTCFADQLKTVITTPDLDEFFRKTSPYSTSILILIDENFKSNDVQHIMRQLPTFVFAPESRESLAIMLQTVKSSSWWHIDAYFFIIGNSQDGCKPAGDILKHAWMMNLLSAFYLCYDEDEGTMLYTYNPYTNRAPHPWKEAKNYVAPDDRWSLYTRKYSEGWENCANLNFDKMRFLDGYKIKGVANTKRGAKWIENKTYNFDSLMERHVSAAIVNLLQIIFSAMNVTVMVNYDKPGYFYNGEAIGFLTKLLNGSYDIALVGRPLVHNVSSSYPFTQVGARILTQQRKFLSPEEKILAFYSVEIWYLTGIVLFITFVFILIILKKRSFAFGAFDVLRLLLSTGMFVPFNRTATRIFFFGIFQLIIILNATFQGNISAFLTKPERIYIDSVEDVQTYRYDIYIPRIYRENLRVETELQTIKYTANVDCSVYVLNDSSAACIQMPEVSMDLAFDHNLHLSRSSIPTGYGGFWCRNDWPLREKLNLYGSHLVEAGLHNYVFGFFIDIPLEKLHSREEQETTARFRPIQMADLIFFFRWLAIGLGTSTIVFIIEMFPWRKSLRIAKRMKTKRRK